MFRHTFRFITILFLVLSISLFITNDAFAKRFGGGKSFGMQRSISSKPNSSYANQTHSNQAMHAPQSTSGRFGKWGAALAGLAAGGLLSYLLMGHGMGASMLSWLAIAVVVMLIVQFFRQRKMQYANGVQQDPVRPQSFFSSAASTDTVSPSPVTPIMTSTSSSAIPGFQEDHFLRDAKAKFIRLQTAYDQKNLSDIREFTVPDVFAEIQLQLNERGQEDNYTEVVELRAELLEAINEFQVPIASVRFSGQLKEGKAHAPISFDETWHFRGDQQGNWKIAGIQQ